VHEKPSDNKLKATFARQLKNKIGVLKLFLKDILGVYKYAVIKE